MPGSTASLEPLSSPSPSPPPSKQHPSLPARSHIHDTTGLDTGSELSELTEDEQESTETNSKTSSHKQPAPRTRRSLVPDQMWGWYKKKSDEKPPKYPEQEEEEEPDMYHPNGDALKMMEEEEDEDEVRESNSNSPDQTPPQPAMPLDNLKQTTPDPMGSDAEDDYDVGNDNDKPNENDAGDTDPDTDDAGDEDDEEEEEEAPTESEEDDEDEGEAPGSVAHSVEPAGSTSNVDRTETTTLIDADIIPLAAATTAAASSIMAGSTVIEAPSQTSSTSSSRSQSPQTNTRRESDKAGNDGTAEIEAVDPPPAIDEVDDNLEDDADHELESDLQPAHRAEALDVLATIELKFALLREKLYVEKVEALAWEESLLETNTHPELIHLDEELLKRRDKRLELASRRRAFEVAHATKRKRTDEDAVWSWWKYERDELQTEMLSETSRKRRRLQRESRSLERPPPVRRIPHIQHELPPPPTLRDITRSMTYAYASGRVLAVTGAYPSLTMLSGMEIEGDLEYLNQHRRGWEMHRGNGQMMHHSFESYGPMDGTSGYGIIPPAPQLQNFSSQSHHPVVFSAHGRQDLQSYPSSFAPPRSISPVSLNNGGHKVSNGWMSGPGIMPGVTDERFTGNTKDSRRDESRTIKQDREREQEREMDRERNYQLQLMHQQQQRHHHQQQQQHQQQQTGGTAHHSHHHHHHVVHHHHPASSAAPSSNTLSPRRVARDLEFSRPRSGPPPSTEVIDLSSSLTLKSSASNTSPVAASGNSSHQESGIPRLDDHVRPSSGFDRPEHSRLPSSSNNSERVTTSFVIPPSQATQAHFSSVPSDAATNPNLKRGLMATDDLLRRPPSAQGSVHALGSASTNHVHSPPSTRSNLSLLAGRPRDSSMSQNSSPRNNRLPLPPPSRSPGPSTSSQNHQLPSQLSPQSFPTPAALIASSGGQNRHLSVSSPKLAIKQAIDPAPSDTAGGGRSGLILNVVELRNPNPPSLHPSMLPGLTNGASPAATPASTSRMNGVSIDGP